MSEVIALNGEHIETTPEPDEDVVQYLEVLLELAKMGDIRGFVAIVRHADGDLDTSYSSNNFTDSRALLGQLHITATILANDLAECMNEAREQ